MGPFLTHSVIATVGSTILVLLLGVPASYALSVHPVKHWRDGLFFFISTKMLPIVAVIGPLYVIALKAHLLDSIWLLIILYTAMNLPLAIWMIRSFMLEVPSELLEAARLDGAGRIREITGVILPVISPGLVSTALICVIFAWNELFLALNLTDHQRRHHADVPDQLRPPGRAVHRAPVGGGTGGLDPGDSRGLGRPALASPRPVDGSHQVRHSERRAAGAPLGGGPRWLR